MPLNVRRCCTSIFLVLFSFVLFAGAQNPPQTAPQQQQTQPQAQKAAPPVVIPPAPTSGDVMRERIAKAKAFIAVRNYSAAIYELENIRRETNDAVLRGVVNVLLMNSYLEQGDYKRAQDFLTEFYTVQKTTTPNATAFYMAVAAQIVKGARDRVERYHALGLNVSDRTLPLESTNDLEKMREMLELVITQSKEIGKDKAKSHDAMALLEEASNSRSMLARDDYDARRWTDQVADAREELANPGRVVMDATGETNSAPNGDLVAANSKPLEKPQVMIPVSNEPQRMENKQPDQTPASNDKPTYVPIPPASEPAAIPTGSNDASKPAQTQTQTQTVQTPVQTAPNPGNNSSPIDVGAMLKNYATNQPSPIYPQFAKATRTTGVVKVEVTISETGEVAAVDKTTGPGLLQSAAKDAIKKWKFKPFLRDGQPVKAIGFVSFNFAL
jgi:TonB family protein